jgi:SAM-dependent methyltransferase
LKRFDAPHAQLGDMHAASFATDPKHLGFVLARYKFVARMLTGRGRVLEVGCGDTTGARVVKPVVGHLTGIDRELYADPCIDVCRHDLLDWPFEGPFGSRFEAIYALDVLEHIGVADESRFLEHLTASLAEGGCAIIGMPSRESQAFASPLSRVHHVNTKTEDELRSLMSWHFRNVFLFGMNDEVLHTGFGPMCHYRLAVCAGAR